MAKMWRIPQSSNEEPIQEMVPDDRIQDLLDAKTHTFRKGDMIPLKRPDGGYMMMPAPLVLGRDLFRKGWTWSYDAQMKYDEQQIYRKELGGMLPAAVGFAGGMTAGGSDLLYSKMLGEDGLRKIEEQDPEGMKHGRVAGVLATVLMPGGGLYGAVGSGAKAAAGAGLAAAGVNAGANLLTKAIAPAIGIFAEGGMIGLGESLSEVSLGRAELMSEHTLANIGVSGALNLGMAGVLQGGGLGLKKSTEVLGDLFKSVTDREMLYKVGERFVRMQTKAASMSEKEAAEYFLTNPELIGMAREDVPLYTKMGKEGADILQKHEDILGQLKAHVQGEGKIKNVQRLVKDQDGTAAYDDIVPKLQEYRQKLEVEKSGSVDPVVRKRLNGEKKSVDKFISQLSDRVTESKKVEMEVTHLGADGEPITSFEKGMRVDVKPGSAADIFNMTDSFKRSLGLGHKDLYTILKDHLETDAIYGAGATMQKEVNLAYERMAAWEKHHDAGRFFKAVDQQAKRIVYQPQADELTKWAKGLRWADSDSGKEYLLELGKRQFDYIKAVSTHYSDVPAGTVKAADRVRLELNGWLGKVREHSVAREQMATLAKMITPTGMVVPAVKGALSTAAMGAGGIAGYAATGGSPLGGLAGASIGAGAAGAARNMVDTLMKPSKTLQWMYRIRFNHNANIRYMADGANALGEAANSIYEGTLGQSTRSVFSKLSDAATYAARAAKYGVREGGKMLGPGAAILGAISFEDPKTAKRLQNQREEKIDHDQNKHEYDRIMGELARIQNDPDRVSKSVAMLFGDSAEHVSDELKGVMSGQLYRATQYLLSTAPQKPAGVPDEAWTPNPQELAKWARKVATVQDPLRVYDSVLAGHVSNDEIECLRATYPELYGVMKEQIVMGVGPNILKLPLSHREAVSKFLGVPVDSLTSPSFTLTMQNNWTQEPQRTPEVAQAPRRDTYGRFSSKGAFSKRTATSEQSREMR